ncbi:hypothetical protein SSX86_006264 [Deinandra increscens subsp. villosa]|uniref:PGG domain-containing protein n=1 Tax=Deinandra increscens subsp. villosa TaxID=3103831 RepID=A0AAP0DIE1_9ASTR
MEGSSSSSNSGYLLYPYPSHVSAPNFVTMKLSGRATYVIWKTQMLCLLESHDMLSFINENPPVENSVLGKEKAGDYMLWRRSDALVRGWILGSLSEQPLKSVLKTNTDFTSKDVWDQLHTIYGPRLQHTLATDLDDERITSEEESVREESSTSKDTQSEDQKETEDHQRLYEATQSRDYNTVYNLLKSGKVKVTDRITINGNTALHLAVGTTKMRDILEKMLEMAPEGNTILDMKNSEGSTLLHVAAIVGNTEAAKILVGKNQHLLSTKDKEGHTPLARALSNMHSNTYLYLFNSTHDIEMATLVSGTSGDELLVNAISSRDYHSTLLLSKHYGKIHSDAPLIAIAQNFPRKLNIWERTIYKWLRDPSGTGGMIYIALLVASCGVSVFFLYKQLTPKTERNPSVDTIVGRIAALVLLLIGVHVAALEFKFLNEGAKTYRDATELLEAMCNLIKGSVDSKCHSEYYNNAVLEASRQNAYDVVVKIVSYFPNAIWSVNEDGHNIIQYAVINRSEKVYNLLYQMSEHKNIYRTIKDPSGNNLLHLAARLAPTNKLNHISGAALQIQRELQWFKEVKGFVCHLNIIQKNCIGETPEMVFTREHKELVIEGEKWMKAVAESYTITAALITTIVFAAAITVPGGSNQEMGTPIFTNNPAFRIFAISDAVSLFTSATSLLMFLSVLTTRFAEQDFLFKLPTKLIIGLTTLFISTTAMLIAFGATLFLVFGQNNPKILVPIAALTCLPITSFATLQFPLIKDLISSTYGRSIFGKKSGRPFY